MGGRVALEVMRRAAGRVERLALLSTGVHPVLPGEAEKRQALIDLAWREGMPVLARQWIPPVLHPMKRNDALLVDALVAMWCRSTPAIHEGQIRAALNRQDARPLLAGIDCPTLVVGGADDPWSPVQQQAEIAAAIPRAELAIISECGHMVAVEQPAELNRLLRDWLTR
jgi:pimeloyl-ACP methyl ester carboxylesterase